MQGLVSSGDAEEISQISQDCKYLRLTNIINYILELIGRI